MPTSVCGGCQPDVFNSQTSQKSTNKLGLAGSKWEFFVTATSNMLVKCDQQAQSLSFRFSHAAKIQDLLRGGLS